MKKWLRILGFVGVGGAGFGVGYFFGNRNKKEAVDRAFDNGFDLGKGYIPGTIIPESDDYELGTIRNSERSGDTSVFNGAVEQTVEAMQSLADTLAGYRGEDPDEDPEMPMEEPKMPDDPLAEDPEEDPRDSEEIPQLHPEDLLPHPISEDEFNRNEKGYDISALRYYAEDDAVYDPEYDDFMPNPEQLLGIGWFALFGPNVDHIYIENDSMGTIYSVHYMHGSIEDT